MALGGSLAESLMLSLLIQRLLQGVLTLFVVSVLVFVGTEILPGDVADAVLGQSATPETVAALRETMGLDRPAPVRYVTWLSGLATGDLGSSLATGRPVSELMGERLLNTLLLALSTAVIAVPLALFIGLLTAIYPRSLPLRSFMLAALCTASAPEFFVAAILVAVFAVKLRWLPGIAYISDGQSLLATMRALALPVMTLTAAVLAHMARMTRMALLNVLESPYIETARLKGTGRFAIVLHHALPNVVAPIANAVAINLAYLIGGVVIVETMFSYPGLAKLMVDAVTTRDIPIVQGCAMVFCAAYVLLNLTADVVSILANPRLRHPR
jgi:peptide/nickel transport system permease protein